MKHLHIAYSVCLFGLSFALAQDLGAIDWFNLIEVLTGNWIDPIGLTAPAIEGNWIDPIG